MNKNITPKNPKLVWPKTPARRSAELEKRQEAIAAVATIGQIMSAASTIPLPRSQKMLSDAAVEAVKGSIGSNRNGKKGKKRAWKEHADNYFAQNCAWDEVNGIYTACMDLLRTSLALTPLLRERALLTLVGNKNLLTRNVKAITRDTQVLAEELSKIRESHLSKAGGSKSQEEMMEACETFSLYVNFMERYDSALMPLVVHASEQLQEALIALELVDPELAKTLSNDLQKTLGTIRGIVHEVTGADEIPSPTEQPVVKPEAETEASI